MRLYLIRHADAGTRALSERDIYRPLSDEGRKQATELAQLLTNAGIVRVLSSPASRCVQTVEPLAQNQGLEVIEHRDLWEGSSTYDALAVLASDHGGPAAVCSHGDVIPAVIQTLGASGVPIKGRSCAKGSIWVLERSGNKWTRARYFDPTKGNPAILY